MKIIKNYAQFSESVINKINECFTITLDQLPDINDIADKIDWKEGEKIAFIDFKGIKNIPIKIVSENDMKETENSKKSQL